MTPNTMDMTEQIVLLRESGLKYDAIAKRVGMSVTGCHRLYSIAKYKERFGVSIKGLRLCCPTPECVLEKNHMWLSRCLINKPHVVLRCSVCDLNLTLHVEKPYD